MGKHLVWLLLVGILCGCGTAGRSYVDSKMTETLEVEVLPNTSKMFVYRLRWPEEQIPSHIRIARGGSNPRAEFANGGIDIGRGTYDRLLENTAYVLEHSGYCRDGFFELDRSISRYHLWVRGECKEAATGADQKKFGPKKVLTPRAWGKT